MKGMNLEVLLFRKIKLGSNGWTVQEGQCLD